MENGPWSGERMAMAKKIIMLRFAQNSVAGHLAPHSTVDEMETTVRRNRYDFKREIVVDREVFGLNEPFSYCWLTKAQVEEFATTQGEGITQSKAVTTLTRAASSLARWHDVLFFRGHTEAKRHPDLRPKLVQMPDPENPSQSLREAAERAEVEVPSNPILVNAPDVNEGLVAAVYDAVLHSRTEATIPPIISCLAKELFGGSSIGQLKDRWF